MLFSLAPHLPAACPPGVTLPCPASSGLSCPALPPLPCPPTPLMQYQAVDAGLRDMHPYVREAAVIGVLKCLHIDPTGVRMRGLLERVEGLLTSDPDPQAREEVWGATVRRGAAPCRIAVVVLSPGRAGGDRLGTHGLHEGAGRYPGARWAAASVVAGRPGASSAPAWHAQLPSPPHHQAPSAARPPAHPGAGRWANCHSGSSEAAWHMPPSSALPRAPACRWWPTACG